GKARIKWSKPKVAMIITKPGDYTLIGMTRELALWLIETPRYGESTGITVYVDEKIKNSTKFKYNKIIKHYPNTVNKLKFWNPELCSSQPSLFDFIITVLFSSWLFQNYIPPVIPFHLGSLGFLTPFDFNHYDKYLTKALDNGVRINLRGRLTCTVYRRVPDYNQSKEKKAEAIKLRNIKRNLITGKITMGNWCKMHEHGKKKKKLNKFVHYNDEHDDQNGYEEHRQVPCFTTIPVEEYHVINELVVDRGPSPYVSQLELFGDNRHLTTVQADGLAISTPTGSTAYSLSAGGSLTDPGIHATLITPICPHTLSFRPTLVPDSMELRICVPYNSRNTAWASFDGRGRVEIKQGDHVKVTASKYPFPTVCKEDQASDWFNSLQKCLHWNKRERQKSFAVVESNSRRRPSSQSRGSTTPTTSSSSSEFGYDEIFGLFSDDDKRKRQEDEFSDDDDNDSGDEEKPVVTFQGWTDTEIEDARRRTRLAKLQL
ncbi:ATP-NAD kinase-like domain-containing protein, partial [Cunninghamella echinulata]